MPFCQSSWPFSCSLSFIYCGSQTRGCTAMEFEFEFENPFMAALCAEVIRVGSTHPFLSLDWNGDEYADHFATVSGATEQGACRLATPAAVPLPDPQDQTISRHSDLFDMSYGAFEDDFGWPGPDVTLDLGVPLDLNISPRFPQELTRNLTTRSKRFHALRYLHFPTSSTTSNRSPSCLAGTIVKEVAQQALVALEDRSFMACVMTKRTLKSVSTFLCH